MGRRKEEKAWEAAARKKLEEIYRRHGAMMMQIAMGILHQPQDAEDAVQNSILAIARHMDVIGEVSGYRTISYVRTVVKHAAIDIYRKKQKGPLSYEEILLEQTDSFDMEQAVCDGEQVRRVIQEIQSLEESYREVLSLFYLNEMSPREIADVLHRPYNTVRSQINRGKKILQRSLREGGVL